jgi:hypothetical protein
MTATIRTSVSTMLMIGAPYDPETLQYDTAASR